VLRDDKITEIERIIQGADTLEAVATMFGMPVSDLYEQIKDEDAVEYTIATNALIKLGMCFARVVATSTPLRISAVNISKYIWKWFGSPGYIEYTTVANGELLTH
jgi:hypothetical protein